MSIRAITNDNWYRYKILLLTLIIFIPLSSLARESAISTGTPPDADHLYPIIKDGKYGFINKKGKLVIEPKYEFADEFSEGLAPVYESWKFGYIKVGFIDTTGNMVIEPFPSSGVNHGFSGGLSVKQTEVDSFGFMDKSGALVIEDKYTFAQKFSEGLAAVKDKDGKYGFIDKNGVMVIELVYDMALYFMDGMAVVGVGDGYRQKYGFINRKGKMLIKPKYSVGSFFFSEGVAKVQDDPLGEPYCIDKSGKKVIGPPCGMFWDGLAAVKVDGKWGFINKSGKFVIKPRFKEAIKFSEGLAGVSVDGKWGFINKAGEIVIKPKYDRVGFFNNGLAAVSIEGVSPFFKPWGAKGYGDGKLGYINSEGAYVWMPVK